MSSSAQRKFVVFASICGFTAALGWGFYAFVFVHEPAQDWMVFYTAARAYIEGNLPLIFDGERFTAVLNAHFGSWLSTPLPLHPWINPPVFLMLILPFAALPFWFSYALFEATSFALLLAALTLYSEDRRRWRLFAVAIALCPATVLTLGAGQSSFLTGALFLAGFGLRSTRPFLAGVLLGLLVYKPQFGLMIPVALLAEREWRTVMGAAISGVLLVLASVALFGVEPWRFWIDFATGSSELYRNWADGSRLAGQSVYACVVRLGGSPTLATFAQSGAAIGAGGAVYWCFRRPMKDALRLAVLLAATLLAAPHVSWSDEMLTGMAAILLLGVVRDEGLRPGDAPLIVLVWLSSFFSPHNIFAVGRLIPLLLVCFIAWVLRRARLASREDPGAALPARS